MKVNPGWGRGDAGRTSSGRGGASIESSDVTANSSSCGWLSTAWDHPRGGGREGASESGVACGSNEMASALLPVRAKSRGRMSLPSGGVGAGSGTRGTRAHLRLLQAGVHDVAVLLIRVLKLRIAHLHGCPWSAPRCALSETVKLFFRWIARHNARSRNAQSCCLATPSPQPGGGVEPRGSCSRHRGGRTPRMRTVGSVGPGPRAPRRRVQKTPTSRTTEESHRQIHENGTRRR